MDLPAPVTFLPLSRQTNNENRKNIDAFFYRKNRKTVQKKGSLPPVGVQSAGTFR
jgi:hypothetical protein